MHLKLTLNGSVDPFVNYLKNFAKIRPSLLIEIDTKLKAFVAKTFSEDRASIRFSAISFDDCHIAVTAHENEKQLGDNRIKIGILIQLPKLIKIVERFGSDVDDKGNSNFDIDVDYDILKNADNNIDYVATSISFSSSLLKMKMDGFRISELRYLDDDTFNNKVFNVQDSVSFEASPAVISSIIKTSDIIKVDPRKDALVFYVDGTDVYVKDTTDKKKAPNFVYKIGHLAQDPGYAIQVSIFREKFIQMMDKTDETFKVILGRKMLDATKYDVDRILFDSLTTPTKVVISRINEG